MTISKVKGSERLNLRFQELSRKTRPHSNSSLQQRENTEEVINKLRKQTPRSEFTTKKIRALGELNSYITVVQSNRDLVMAAIDLNENEQMLINRFQNRRKSDLERETDLRFQAKELKEERTLLKRKVQQGLETLEDIYARSPLLGQVKELQPANNPILDAPNNVVTDSAAQGEKMISELQSEQKELSLFQLDSEVQLKRIGSLLNSFKSYSDKKAGEFAGRLAVASPSVEGVERAANGVAQAITGAREEAIGAHRLNALAALVLLE